MVRVNKVLYAKHMSYDGFGNIMTGLTEAEFDYVDSGTSPFENWVSIFAQERGLLTHIKNIEQYTVI